MRPTNDKTPARLMLTPEEYHAVLRCDFSAFTERAFVELHPHGLLIPSWHLDMMVSKLEAVRRGEIKRLIINVPPRSLKSSIGSVALPAFWLGHRPSEQILCVSYGQDLANKHSADCRAIMSSPWYQRIFPTRLSSQRQAVEEFATTARGFRMATSVGGVLTGRGANLIVIDDPLKPDEAVSEVQRRKVNEWYDSVLYSRLNNKETGAIIIIMQRLHLDDLVGHVTAQEPWEILSLPAIATAEERHLIQSPWGTYTHLRHEGEALQPERESLETLALLRSTMGEYNFSGQYQQAPVPLGGGMVKDVWWQVYEPRDEPDKWDRVIQSWDTANRVGDLSDFSVGTTWGMKGPKIYLLHVLRRRMDYPTLKRAVKEQAKAFNATTVLVEDKASGTQLIQELQQEGLYAVRPVKPQGDKVMRMHAQTGVIENGFVYLPKQAPWLEEYRAELSRFPMGKFDDQVDSTSQALAWIQKEGQVPLTFLRLQEWMDSEYGPDWREKNSLG